MAKPCLIIIFNHRYDKNIPILRQIYSPRFSNIYFLVPFYDGDDPFVIPVYESSFYFQSFFAQGFHRFFREEFSHYIFTGDDCLLNPTVNETNYLEQTGLPVDADFIPGFIEFHKLENGGWWHTQKAVDFFKNRRGAEIQRELPSKEEALARFRRHGVSAEPLTGRNIFGTKKISHLSWWQSRLYKEFHLRVKWKKFWKNGKIEPPYPSVGSYSDMFIIQKETIREFCRYCGVLASVGLFVEIAIPTSLLLSSRKIVQEKDFFLQGKALWLAPEIEAVEKEFNRSLTQLMQGFPSGQLYIHPVKLSKWTNDL